MTHSDPSLHEWWLQGREDADEMNVDLEGTVEDIRLNAGIEEARAYRLGFNARRNKNNDALLTKLEEDDWFHDHPSRGNCEW